MSIEEGTSLYQAIDDLLNSCQLWEIRVERYKDITPETLVYIDVCEEDDEETVSLITSEELDSNFRKYFSKQLEELNEEFDRKVSLGDIEEDDDDFLDFTPTFDEYRSWKLQVIKYLGSK
jgi:hypothetical protein